MTREESINELIEMYNYINGNIEIRRKQYEALNIAIEALKQTEQKKGKWIECNHLVFDKYLLDTNTFFRCSLCAHDVKRKTKYCSECGAKMEEEEERRCQ